MHGRTRIIPTLLILAALATACAPSVPGDSRRAADGAAPGPSAAVKRITFGTAREQDFRPNAQGPERLALQMVLSGLTVRDGQRVRHSRLAEAVPTLDNGLWKLFPDGRMETSWVLRAGARWHDGAPVTSEDLLFSMEVGRDREMSAFNVQAYASIEDVWAPDARTLTISWKEPFIDADGVLGQFQGGLLPKHLLETTYRTDKTAFLDVPYWTSEFVGAGPYRLREWVAGVSMLLEANGDYVLGRPPIDQVQVRYILDANTLSANLLAGTVDITGLIGSIDLAIQLREQWGRGGTVAFNYGSDLWVALFPQFVDPRPAVVADLQFRRALAHAIDRQELVDTLVSGMSPVAYSFMSPNQAAYRDVEAALPRYEYDPRRAAQMLEAQGYAKGPDGIYRDATNRRLELELRGGPEEEAFKTATAIANFWQRLGVDTTPSLLTPQQFQDAQYAATFPAFHVFRGLIDVNAFRFMHGSQTRLPSNNFRISGPGNRARYMSPEFDALIDTYFQTVPVPQRIQAIGRIIDHMADQMTVLGLYYLPEPGAFSERMLNVSKEWPASHIVWNSHEWDVRK